MTYKLIVDYGRPYEEDVNSEDLKSKLKDLKEISEKEDYPYFDIKILVLNEVTREYTDITETQFIKELIEELK